MLAETLPGLEDEREEVVAMEVERTFWEKATILHSEYHRPAGQPIGDRFSRHYSDLAALWKQPAGAAALIRLDLLTRVALFKSRFFGSSWANYDRATTGSLRLVPPDHRHAELRQDYSKMESMFLTRPPTFGEVLETLHDAESRINLIGSAE
jgi:Nucleotidyl transferase AbiEii toxin, Type IV TA system